MLDSQGRLLVFLRKPRRKCPDWANPILLRAKFDAYLTALNALPAKQTGNIIRTYWDFCKAGTDALMQEELDLETLSERLQELELVKDDDYSKWNLTALERKNYIEAGILQHDIYYNAILRKKRNFESRDAKRKRQR